MRCHRGRLLALPARDENTHGARVSFEEFCALSPFELRRTLRLVASSHGGRTILNAVTGNPNFLATIPRHGFLQLGQFALNESERANDHVKHGIADPRPSKSPPVVGPSWCAGVGCGTPERGVLVPSFNWTAR